MKLFEFYLLLIMSSYCLAEELEYSEIYQKTLSRTLSTAELSMFLEYEVDPIKRGNVINALIFYKAQDDFVEFANNYLITLEAVNCESKDVGKIFDKVHFIGLLYRFNDCSHNDCGSVSIDILRQCLNVNDEMLRAQAVQLLGAINAKESFNEILQIIEKDSVLVSVQAASGILMNRNLELKEKLLEFIDSSSITEEKAEVIRSMISRYK